ncbi:hypothetical protein RHDC4_03349 [Rhodocyclaceae bacterium]|nr:hypothetical protein RHDC4_03349 [Rhodocyclaceae bacterium]
MDGRVDLERTARTVGLSGADVVCLQEVAVNHPGLPGGPCGNQSQQLAGWFPGYAAIYGVGSDLHGGTAGRRQFGVLILSRLPVLQVFRHLLPWPADPAVPSMQRVALEVVLKAPGGALRVMTTHLEFYSRLQREAQVVALRALYEEGWRHALRPRSGAESDPPFAVLPRGERTVLCGDFNFLPGSSEYLDMLAPVGEDVPCLRDAWHLVHGVKPHAPTAGIHGVSWLTEPGCCDFFFVGENLAPALRDLRVDEECLASDHQPVLLELIL